MISIFTKKIFIKLFITLIIFFIPISKFKVIGDPASQKAEKKTDYPQNYFRWPLDIPIEVLGTFAELRPNHFHSGIDIRTQQREGIPVYSVADGYISRIRIQASGFGNALYITHPNGFVSVYAHLRNFNPSIKNFIQKIQYQLNSFEVDTLLPKNLIRVSKSDQIANSGNSGASQGPHLHFDIRDARTEEPLNFLKFYPVPDHKNPVIGGLYIYPLGETSRVNNSKNKLRLMHNGSAKASGEIGLGIICDDGIDNSSSRNGVYSIELSVNGKKIYYSEMNKFKFENTRALNAHIDYKEKLTTGKTIQKCFVSPGNDLGIYKHLENQGRFKVEPGKFYQFKYVVSDVAGNQSAAIVNVQGEEEAKDEKTMKLETTKTILWNQDFKFIGNDFKIDIPAKTLFEDVPFEFLESEDVSNKYSNKVAVMSKYVPANSNFQIALNLKEGLSNSELAKLYVHETGKGYCGGVISQGYLRGESKYFGEFSIAIDNIKPSINPINIFNGKAMYKNNGILMRIYDKQSGIKSYTGKIDGKWVLMRYDQKYQTLNYYWDENCPKGKHVFELEVVDNRNNKSTYTANFTR